MCVCFPLWLPLPPIPERDGSPPKPKTPQRLTAPRARARARPAGASTWGRGSWPRSRQRSLRSCAKAEFAEGKTTICTLEHVGVQLRYGDLSLSCPASVVPAGWPGRDVFFQPYMFTHTGTREQIGGAEWFKHQLSGKCQYQLSARLMPWSLRGPYSQIHFVIFC